jgi:signal transduction histidine kinase
VTALNFLPDLLAEPGETESPARLLGRLAVAFGAGAAGVRWPADGPPKVDLAADAGGDPLPPTNDHAGRLTAPIPGPAGPDGRLWIDGQPGQTPSDENRAALTLAGKMLGRSPWLARLAPAAATDPHRLAGRLADTAVVAGRMAHDFDNVLTGIMGFAELSQPAVPPNSPTARYLAELLRVAQRGVQMTQLLHQFSRGGSVNPQPAAVADALALEEARLRNRTPPARLRVDAPADLPPVALNIDSLRVLMGHVLDNAVEAAPDSPVRVEAGVADLGPGGPADWQGNLTPGRHVEVRVTDAGAGIAPASRGRLFRDPFHTTKARHHGLGLAVVYRILYAHRGGLRVEDAAPGPGACVRIVLPASAQPSPPTAFSARGASR